MQVAAGRPEAAISALKEALVKAPGHARALAVLGAAEFTLMNYAPAAVHLQEALAAAPEAGVLHYQLSLVHRALGDAAKADAELAKRGPGGVVMSDPRLDELRDLLDSAMAFDVRSREALARGNWPAAVADARRGLEMEGTSPSLRATLHHRLGTALAQLGDRRGARREFELAVAARPAFVPGHYSLALMLASSGEGTAAFKELSDALRFDPAYLPARIARADMLRETASLADALTEYRIALRANRESPPALFGEAVTLVALHREGEALAVLESAVRSHPTDDSLALALARVMAGTGQTSSRDPSRALALAEPIVRRRNTLDAIETLALALASGGHFEEAASLGQSALAQARQQQLPAVADALTGPVRAYRRRQLPPRLWSSQPVYEPTP
jgi:tetratricopeptide (TPR) repeat protein